MRLPKVLTREFWVADAETSARLSLVDQDLDGRLELTPIVVAAHPPRRARDLDPWAPARPEWDDLTPAEQSEHRDECYPANGGPCALCDGYRAWGGCPSCERLDAEIVDGLTLCCKVRGLMGDEFERWYVA